jgi:hypothetical protein
LIHVIATADIGGIGSELNGFVFLFFEDAGQSAAQLVGPQLVSGIPPATVPNRMEQRNEGANWTENKMPDASKRSSRAACQWNR